MPRRPSPARLSSLIGIAVALAGAGFVVEALASQWDTVEQTFRRAEPLWLMAGAGFAVAAMVGIALPWHYAIRILGAQAHRSNVLVWYFLGELGKYLPGGFWPVVGRAELAQRAGLARATAYGSTTLSLGAAYLGAMLAGIGLMLLDVTRRLDTSAPIWVFALLPVGILALHPRIVAIALHLASKLLRRDLVIDVPSWRASVGLVVRYVPAWFFVATATWAVARALDPSASYAAVAFAAVLSWVVGFLVLPAPGGLGIREAVFTAAAGLPLGVAATTAVTARLVFIFVDAGGAGVAALFWRRSAPGRHPEASPVNDLESRSPRAAPRR